MRQDKFLKSQKILRLATIDNRGMPHIVPVWYLYKDGIFYVGTNTSTKKAKNVKKNPKVSFCVDAGIRSPIFGVMGRGVAKLIFNKKIVSSMTKKILLRYFSSLNNNSAQELLAQTDCIIKITPRKITVWEF
ncbi:MAG TPA: pyridoxamine 5'-phosphate oxidase family protein [Nitrosopumilaceae archaeon]|nr:pyridoxamine 5'-phosphate oxidase family protein [Nitrosopumilaceae archaeon]HXV38368.1 pyridoxamine 5'-phosphate oxidase family protein [Nitrosopumilaceae archaeon]